MKLADYMGRIIQSGVFSKLLPVFRLSRYVWRHTGTVNWLIFCQFNDRESRNFQTSKKFDRDWSQIRILRVLSERYVLVYLYVYANWSCICSKWRGMTKSKSWRWISMESSAFRSVTVGIHCWFQVRKRWFDLGSELWSSHEIGAPIQFWGGFMGGDLASGRGAYDSSFPSLTSIDMPIW